MRMSFAYSCIGPDDEARIRDEHAFLVRQLEEVTRLAAADDRGACEVIWEVFVREMEQHMRYEESLLFPSFDRSGLAPDRWTERLRAEHEELRGQCRALGSELHHPVLCIERLHDLARTLLTHKEREGRLLYPWLASLSRPQPLWGGMRGFHVAVGVDS
jgi:iron-sulfur cluster repair protein YtfE (RIC family)